MATSGNKSAQLCVPKVKTVQAGFYTYSKQFVKAWGSNILEKNLLGRVTKF